VLTSTSPHEALEKLDDVDLVMADHRMPGMTGVEFLTQVRSARPEATRVLLTAYSDLEIAIAALERAEVHYYLRKPWEPGEMRALLESVSRSLPRAEAT
jgi:response regulator RpfG family c-di-GMP phosphodiesterase